MQHFIHLQRILHARDDDALGVRLLRACMTKVVDNRRTVMFDLGQQLLGSESWIDVELAIEEFVIGAF